MSAATTPTNKPLAREFVTLGRTGLKVSRFSLGAGTFGWGTEEDEARKIFQAYRAAGGNYIDTANLYGGGKSEEWLGRFMEEENCRDELVISTKFTFNMQPGNPNAGGNGRKNILKALDDSLKRLRTSYVDIYFMHVYDLVTPVEEVMATLNDLVRAGKIHHIGISDAPAWYIARAQTIAQLRGWEPVTVIQLEYSLIARSLEREHLPMIQELGISLMPWSPLGSGFLTGKYNRDASGNVTGDGRVTNFALPSVTRITKEERNWEIADKVVQIAAKLKVSPAEVALAWVIQRPQATVIAIGARTLSHLEQNLKALDVSLPADVVRELDEVSKLSPNELDNFFDTQVQAMVNGGAVVKRGIAA